MGICLISKILTLQEITLTCWTFIAFDGHQIQNEYAMKFIKQYSFKELFIKNNFEEHILKKKMTY